MLKQSQTEDRLYMTLTYNACGRGGEAACSSFDQMEYLSCEDCMMLQWGELKTLDQDTLPFIVDKNKWKICVVNSFAWYMIAGGPDSQKRTNQDQNYLFPNRAVLKDSGAAGKLTTKLQVR